MHEAKLWPVSSYVTLTYDDEHLPPGGSLSLRDLQLFMKRLRKAKEPARIRFFAGGEYGDLNKRPHYHLLLFNCGFSRLSKVGESKGFPIYGSPELTELWTLGKHFIGEVSFESAVYVAKYCLKKVTGARAADHYAVFDSFGVVHDRRPEFALMSRRPGIGSGYYEKYGQEVRDHDSVVCNSREVRPTRFYDFRFERMSPEVFASVKRKRKRLAVLSKADNTQERLRVKERLMELAAAKKERSL